jgi:diadenosine tetraphosphate (Ap4A) HIT family hydrolase|tara:strand:- start:3209 stop:3838 length:630 start_codon:yes stop_codon:yes gene_type:complete
MENLNNCIFCDEKIIEQGILDESENFWLRANFYPSSPGHCMIISKKHYSCFAAMPKTLDDEYLEFLETSKERIGNAFSKPIVTEQGVHGQSVNHAHTHIFPSVSGIYDFSKKGMNNFVKSEISFTVGSDLKGVRRIFDKEGEYVTIQENGRLFIYHTKGYPGILVPCRNFIAEMTGLTHLCDWRTMSKEQKQVGDGWFRETIEKLGESK